MKESLEAYHKLWTILKECFIEFEKKGMLRTDEESKNDETDADFIYHNVSTMAFSRLRA
jgi:hypothetical protein